VSLPFFILARSESIFVNGTIFVEMKVKLSSRKKAAGRKKENFFMIKFREIL
jgi:hypothetical protein